MYAAPPPKFSSNNNLSYYNFVFSLNFRNGYVIEYFENKIEQKLNIEHVTVSDSRKNNVKQHFFHARGHDKNINIRSRHPITDLYFVSTETNLTFRLNPNIK